MLDELGQQSLHVHRHLGKSLRLKLITLKHLQQEAKPHAMCMRDCLERINMKKMRLLSLAHLTEQKFLALLYRQCKPVRQVPKEEKT
jgi:hypothetical protein